MSLKYEPASEQGVASGPHTLTVYTSETGVFLDGTGTLTLKSDPFQVSGTHPTSNPQP